MNQALSDASTALSDYDHVTWWVSNAKQAAAWYCMSFGFKEIAYRGLETGSKDVSSHVVNAGSFKMVFTSAIRPRASLPENAELVQEIHDHVALHGDGVRDVAYRCDDVHAVYTAAIAAGATSYQPPKTFSDEFGSVVTAVIGAYADTKHTLIDRSNYNGEFMPGYVLTSRLAKGRKPHAYRSVLEEALEPSGIETIDHCVANQGWDQMQETCDFYERALGFHKFWSVDDKTICTDFSALNSTVMASSNEKIKMPINEPAKGKRTSQVEEFVQFYGTPGVQHIALLTRDIISTIKNLRQRGVEFIDVPASYYEELRRRLAKSPVEVREDLCVLESLDILVDFDENGYLLQLFTKPLSDRPTIFFEIIQRENFDGFGAGNFKSLFEAIERDQSRRGTL